MPQEASRTTAPTFLDARHGWWLVKTGGPGQPLETLLWRTDDGGGSWHRLVASGLPADGAALGFRWLDPMQGVVALTDGHPSLYRTEDGGAIWRPSLMPVSPLPGTTPFAVWPLRLGGRLVAWLAVSSVGQVDLGAAGSGLDVSTYLLTSGDGGRKWGPPVAGPRLLTRSLGPPAIDSSGRLLLLEGRRLWVSEDGGATWTARVAEAPSGVTPAALIEVANGALFATAFSDTIPRTVVPFLDRLLRSTDGGAHWESVPLPR